jgi:acetoin utilization protein AcuB
MGENLARPRRRVRDAARGKLLAIPSTMTTTKPAQDVAAWMRTHVHVVHPGDSIEHARALCERHRVNQLPVVTDGRLVGILTDRDLREAFPSVAEEAAHPAEAHRLSKDLRVDDIMTRNVMTVTERDGIDFAAVLMQRERVGALPVVRKERLVGILTRTDLLSALVALITAARGRSAS